MPQPIGISAVNDNKYSKPRQENVKPSVVVITYSVCEGSYDKTLLTMAKSGSSVHYTIDLRNGPNEDELVAYQNQHHNDVTDVAFYAGKSSWLGQPSVNEFGIGIMLVNDASSPFPDIQIDKLCRLLDDIKVRHSDIDFNTNLVGLGEVAAKHQAPGKHFPWAKLAVKGFGQFYETTTEQQSNTEYNNPDEVKEKIKAHGYPVEQIDGFITLEKLITTFNSRYVPEQEHLEIWSGASQYVFDKLHPQTGVIGDTADVSSSLGELSI